MHRKSMIGAGSNTYPWQRRHRWGRGCTKERLCPPKILTLHNSSHVPLTTIRLIRAAWGTDVLSAIAQPVQRWSGTMPRPVVGVEQGACHVLQFLLSSAVANVAKASLPNS